jgi:hypothetical protein
MGMDVNTRSIGNEPPVKRANQAAPQPVSLTFPPVQDLMVVLLSGSNDESTAAPRSIWREGGMVVQSGNAPGSLYQDE